jgi:hypothetical protein
MLCAEKGRRKRGPGCLMMELQERSDRDQQSLPSDRSTGLVVSAMALGAAYVWRAHEGVHDLLLTLAAALAAISLIIPRLVHPLNVIWMRVGGGLARVMNPAIMLVVFAVTIVPAGLMMQVWRDPLARRRRTDRATYWRDRESQDQASMADQF